jgi:hypothetical protein
MKHKTKGGVKRMIFIFLSRIRVFCENLQDRMYTKKEREEFLLEAIFRKDSIPPKQNK